ncbi:MAG: hypothetical protein R3Y63_08950 [Eubacteriales bacterium]
MLKDFSCVRLADGEYGVNLELLSKKNEVYLIEILEENDTSGVPLDEIPVHISEIKAVIEYKDGQKFEIPLDTFEQSIPPVSYRTYRDSMSISNH